MKDLLPFIIVGLVSGSLYGLAAVGLVLTYRTSGVFNFAHGSVAAGAAFLFDTLHRHGMGWPLAALITVISVGVVAGIATEQITRRLIGAPEALSVVATVAILLGINGYLIVQYGTSKKVAATFLPQTTINVAGVFVTYAQIISALVAVACVVVLYLTLRYTRLGVAMRAVVDNPQLVGLAGAKPVRIRAIAWVIGSSFAALSGILIAPTVGLDAFLLTLLVVQAFGAAAIGRFSSLPLTYAGGLVVGLLSALATRYFSKPPLNGIPASIPFLVLVAALLIIPVRKLPGGGATTRGLVSRRQRLDLKVSAPLGVAAAAGLIALPHLVGTRLPVWTGALTMLIMFASLALLVLTSGQISLCHTAFAAIGATTLSHLTLGAGLPWGVALILAGVAAVPLGILVAIPALRLSGVYLALATFGFAILMQTVLYNTGPMFGKTRFRNVSRPVLGFFDGRDDFRYYYIVLAIAAASCLILMAINRGRLGRLLRAMSETPTMLSTHGLSVRNSRLIVFCISAFFAGIAGGLIATQASAVSPLSFEPVQSLLWLTVLAICGTRLLASSTLAAALLVAVPSYMTNFTNEKQLLSFGVLGVAATILVANAPKIATAIRRLSSEAKPRTAASPVRDRWDRVRTIDVRGTAEVAR